VQADARGRNVSDAQAAEPRHALGVQRLEPGALLRDRYEIRRTLGEGGMGVVYEAHDRVRATRVALKTIRFLDAAGLFRFKNEFRALVDVSHRNLATLHELESEGDGAFFTMEYVEGVDFFRYVAKSAPGAGPSESTDSVQPAEPARGSTPRTPLDATPRATPPGPRGPVACDVALLRPALAQLVQGVSALHACGKLHRDLKPSNVLVATDGRVVVLDFGLVSSLARDGLETVDQNVVGTPEYMSPEQAAVALLTEASDWYAVGVMLYEALTGRLPFAGPPLKIIIDKQRFDPPRPGELVEGVPDDLEALCMDLLQRDPKRRPAAQAIFERLGAGQAPVLAMPMRRAASTMPSLATTFVGREAHMVALAEAYGATLDGTPIVAHVHGSSGMGKSLLVRRFLEMLGRDAVVLSGRCYERESVPYKALDSVVDALSRHLRRQPRYAVDAVLPLEIHALTRVFPVLNRVEAIASAPLLAYAIPDPQELRGRAANALRELLARMAVRKPLVVWIDDLQWGDVDSAALIRELLRPPTPPRMLMLLSYRSEDAAAPILAELRSARDHGGAEAREIVVGPLELDEARALAVAQLGPGEASHVLAAIIAKESCGNPLFVDELVRHVGHGKDFDRTLGGTLRLDDVLYEQVTSLPDDARRLLEIVAIAGQPVARAVAASAAELEGEREVTALAVLRAGRLVRSMHAANRYDVETYHDRIRQTVVARLAPSARKRLHHHVALALVAAGQADPEALFAHFSEAGEARRAAEFAAVAAAKAVDALAFGRAAALWRGALALPGVSDESRRDLQWKLGDALANAGRGGEAAEAYLEAAAGASKGNALELRRRAAEQLMRSGRIPAGIGLIDDVLAAVGARLRTSPLLILVSLVLHGLRLRLRGLHFTVRDGSELTAKELTRVDLLWSVGLTLGMVRPVLAKLYQRKHLLRALRAGDPMRVARGIALEATSSGLGGVPARARTEALLRAVRELSRRVDSPYCHAWVEGAEGIRSYLEGCFRAAIEHCDRAAVLFRDHCAGATYELANVDVFALQSLFHLGEMALLARRLPALTQEARVRGDLYLLTNIRLGLLNAVWLVADDDARAENELDEAVALWGTPEQQLQQYYELLARVQIDLYRGRGLAGHVMVDARWPAMRRAHLHRIQIVRLQLAHLRARAAVAAVAAGEASGERAAGLLASALSDAHGILRERLRWSSGLARLIEAAVQACRGERERAASTLAVAIEELEASDMALWAAAARRRRGELLGGEEGRVLVDAADEKLRAEGVRAPERYCAMLAPGFGGGV
jgi:hypothetical protein